MCDFNINDIDAFSDDITSSGKYLLGDQDNGLSVLSENRASNHILIAFSGAIMGRANKTPPFFSFENIARQLNISLIAFSDPTVDRGKDCSLAWYLGNDKFNNLHEVIARICDNIILKTGKKLILAGGSGGGFAALSIHQLMKDEDSSVSYVWNPQTNILNYSLGHVSRFLNQAYPSEKESWFKDKSKTIEFLEKKKIQYKFTRVKNKKTIIYMDGYDSPHIRMHLKDYFINNNFLEIVSNGILYDQALVFIGNWGVGHTPPPRDMIYKAFENIISGCGFDDFDILYDKESNKIPLLKLENHKKFLSDNFEFSFKLAGHVLCCRMNLPSLFIGYSVALHFFVNQSGEEQKVGSSGFISKTANEDIFIDVSKISDLESLFIRVHVFDFFNSKLSLKFPLSGLIEKQGIINLL